MTDDLIRAGKSDKYGQVYVEKVGNTGFEDPDEPVAVLRAQDVHAYDSMLDYFRRCNADPDVSDSQRRSVSRQVQAFLNYRKSHPNRIRKPGR